MKRSSIALRLVAAAILWIGGALLAGGLLLSTLFRGYVERSFDAHLEVLLTSLIAATDANPVGELTLSRDLGDPRFNKPISGWYWQISDANGSVLRSRSLWDEELPHRIEDENQVTTSWTQTVGKASLRMLQRKVTLPGASDTYQFVVAGDTSEMRREIKTFDFTLFWSLTMLGLGLGAAIFIQVRYGLSPMRRLRDGLASIRSGNSDMLNGEFPVEVKPLVDELNALLDHNKLMVDRARTDVGNLAHALKTPLSVLAAEASSARGPSQDSVRTEVAKIRRQVDHHLARAHAAASGRTLGVRTQVIPIVEAIKRTLERLPDGHGVIITAKGDNDAVFRGQRQDLEEMLGNLMENGCKWARSELHVNVTRDDDRIVVTIDDDGPGLDPEHRNAVLERGIRLDETAPGSGLGLAIVRDIVTNYGGKFRLDDSPFGGLRATLALPSAGDAT